MKRSFLEYLKEEQEYDFSNEKFFHFNESNEIDGLEEGKYDWEQFENINENNDLDGDTFGDELLINLDWNDKNISEEETEDKQESKTIQYLRGRGRKSISDLQRDFVQYIVEPPDAPQSGYKLMRRHYMDPDGERHEISKDEIEAILAQKNRSAKKPDFYDFDENGNLTKNGKFITSNRKVGFLKKLNTAIEKWQKNTGNTDKIHLKWEIGSDGKPTNRLMINTTEWDDSDTQNLKRYDSAKYEVLSDKDTQEFLKNIINKKDNSEEKNSKRQKWSYDYDKHIFKYGDREIYGKELLKMVSGLNGGITADKKQKEYIEDQSYWHHFKISVSGSKVGDVANFSLPPVITCNKDAPCISDGCYAIKASAMYPSSRMAQEINLALLQEGNYDQFEDEVCKVFQTKKGQTMKYFRFFVSGDVFSKELMNSICNIAKRNSNRVNFWMYTKQYALISQFIGKIPSNLTVLISCWGDFCPSIYEGGKYAELEKNFPLAYLDDGTENTKKYMNVEKEKIVCPCTDDDEVVAHCDNCKKCFEVGNLKGNIVFKKH